MMEKLYKELEIIVLGIVFFGLVTPISLFLKLVGRDTLKRQFNSEIKSYWVVRAQSQFRHQNFYKQYIQK